MALDALEKLLFSSSGYFPNDVLLLVIYYNVLTALTLSTRTAQFALTYSNNCCVLGTDSYTLIFEVSLHAAERTQRLAETGRYEPDALLLPSEDTLAICYVCPDADFDELLIADASNRCVKSVSAPGRAALVFHCGADSTPRALQLVLPVDGGGTTLLLVERIEVEEQASRYALVVAARSGQRFDEKRRLPLQALSKEDPMAPVRMATKRGRFVLIGNERAKTFEVIYARGSSGIARLAAPLPLHFA